LDMTGLNPGDAEIYSPARKGPVPVPGIVLFLGAAIPGDPAWGYPGTILCVPSTGYGGGPWLLRPVR
jgi:hypothetical protein